MQIEDVNLLTFRFSLSGIAVINLWERVAIMNMLGDLGGITALLVFTLGPFVRTYQNFNIDNSMLKRLYTLPKLKG